MSNYATDNTIQMTAFLTQNRLFHLNGYETNE